MASVLLKGGKLGRVVAGDVVLRVLERGGRAADGERAGRPNPSSVGQLCLETAVLPSKWLNSLMSLYVLSDGSPANPSPLPLRGIAEEWKGSRGR